MKKQRGFTLFELIYAICWVGIFAITFGTMYATYHFITKFW